MCEAHKDMSPSEFWGLIHDYVERMVAALVDEIGSYVQDEAVDVQATIEADGEGALTKPQRDSIDYWNNKIGVDLRSVDLYAESSWSIPAGVRHDIEAGLRQRIGAGPTGGGGYGFESSDFPREMFGLAAHLPVPGDSAAMNTELESKLVGDGALAVVDPTKDSGDQDAKVRPGGLLGVPIEEAGYLTNDVLKDWESDTATTFKGDFLPEVEYAAEGHTQLVETLRNLLDLHQGAIETARDDFCRLGNDAAVAFESMDCHSGEIDGKELTSTLGMIAGAAAVAAAVSSGNFMMAFGIASGTASFFQSAWSAGGGTQKPVDFGAKDWEELIDRVAEHATTVATEFDAACASISTGCEDFMRHIESRRDRYTIETA